MTGAVNKTNSESLMVPTILGHTGNVNVIKMAIHKSIERIVVTLN